jgi:flagellar assembly factor FliW
MKIDTKFFGTQEINEDNIINFEHGIPGFESCHRFVISTYNNESPFLVMQSVERIDLAFILTEYEKMVPGYSIDLNDEITAELKLEKPENAAVVAIVNIQDDLARATVNLAAPIIINMNKKIGKQIILNNPAYGLKHPLFDQNSVKQAEAGKSAVNK